MGARRLKRHKGRGTIRNKSDFDSVVQVNMPSDYEQRQKELRTAAQKVLKRVQLQRIIKQAVFG